MTREETRAYDERRSQVRHAAEIDVNYRGDDTYLFCRSSNISELGIFLVVDEPAAPGTYLALKFAAAPGAEPIRVTGEVMWAVPPGAGRTPGMGVRFVDPSAETRERIRSLIRTIAVID